MPPSGRVTNPAPNADSDSKRLVISDSAGKNARPIMTAKNE
jgi:hypothetical protein